MAPRLRLHGDGPNGWQRRGLGAAPCITIAALLVLVLAPTDVDLTPDWLPTAETTFNVLGALASLVAIFAFVPWALQQRRRPELEVLWKIAPSDDVDDLAGWAPGAVAEVPHGPVIVETSVLNVGDATAAVAESNFYVPGAVGLERWRGDDEDTPNPDAEPYPIRFLPKTFAVAPGNWFQQRFRLTMPDDPGQTFRLTFVVSEGRFDATGRRLFSSRGLTDGDVAPTLPETAWPPPSQSPRWWHLSAWGWAQAKPKGRLLCRRGVRADVRNLRVRVGRAAWTSWARTWGPARWPSPDQSRSPSWRRLRASMRLRAPSLFRALWT